MEQRDLLLTTAEVAVAVAGFAALVTVLSRRRDTMEDEINAIRLRAMVESSFMVIAFCFLPLVLREFGMPDRSVWRLSSFASMVIGGGYSFHRWRASRLRFGTPLGPYPRFLVFTYSMIVIWEGLLALNALGVFSSSAAAVYLLVLYLQLLMAGIFFLRLVASVLNIRQEL